MKRNKPRMTNIFILFFALTSFLGFSTAFAATIRVPSEQSTIQAGIDAAVDGDTVLVADGTYTGEGNQNIDFKGKAITVESENGAANCIIDCEDYSVRGFYFHSNETETSVLRGFTVKNSNDPNSSAISCSSSSSPTITGCTISGNSSDGIEILYSSSPTITGCTVSGNGGTGINLNFCSSSPTITGCTVSGNGGFGIVAGDGSSTITGCTVSGNGSAGIIISTPSSYSSSSTITGCTVSGNGGVGIDIGYGSPTITGCTISGNSSHGIDIYSSTSSRITNCLITGNATKHDFINGSGIHSTLSSPTIVNCTITGNTATDAGGVSLLSGVIKNTIVWGNTLDASEIDSSVAVKYSNIAGYSGGGDGNIDQDPLFVGSGSYKLSGNSPCIDTGTSSGAPSTDIDGTSRPQGAGYDMGAYEFSRAPLVTTIEVSSITLNSAKCGGNVTSEGESTVTARGVCWNTSANPTTSNDKTTDGTGSGVFTSSITGLIPGTTYHVRAYATNGSGTSYGRDIAFNTFYASILYVNSNGNCGGKTPCYDSIQEAVDATESWPVALVGEGVYNESFVLDESKTLYLRGGWDSTFTTQPSYSSVNSMRISNGTVIIDNLVIK